MAYACLSLIIRPVDAKPRAKRKVTLENTTEKEILGDDRSTEESNRSDRRRTRGRIGDVAVRRPLGGRWKLGRRYRSFPRGVARDGLGLRVE
jgi:hypothetical protein